MPRLEDLSPDAVAAAVSRAVVDAVAEGGDVEIVVARALAQAKAALRLSETGARPDRPQATATPPPPAPHVTGAPRPKATGASIPHGGIGSGSRVVTEDDVLSAARSGQAELRLGPGSLVTPLARDAAIDAGIRLVEG